MLRSLTIVSILIIAIIASFHLDRPGTVKSVDSKDFSAERVMNTLASWGNEPHPIGSFQLQKVRDQIVDELTNIGLKVTLENGYTSTTWNPAYKRMAYVENILATLPGDGSSDKTIVLCGHYDSVVEGPGAGDDGYAIASMIETINLLKSKPRKHNILLLITDGEEYGLLGAKYHMENNKTDDYAVLLNYEARGNEGPGIAFEWSENNHWLVSQVSEAYKRPIANSMSYEVYKIMPNSSDFSEFLEYDIIGINHAFIDGFSYYHHPQDDVDHLSPESVQHTGENMYLAAQHFVNTDLDVVHDGNATFFNFYGAFVYYRSSIDLFLIIIGLILSLLAIARILKQEPTTMGKFLASFFTLLIATLIILGIVFGLSISIKSLYPHYATFYAHQYYNHEWYLLAGIGLVAFAGIQTSSIVINKWGVSNFKITILVLLAMLSIGIYLNLTTGAYLFIIPMMCASCVFLFPKNKSSDLFSTGIGVILLIIILGIWVFLSHTLYLAFSITILAGAVVPSLLFFYLLSGIFYTENRSLKHIVSVLGLGLFVVSMVAAHIKSKPTQEKPLLTDLSLYHHSWDGKSYLASNDDHIYFSHPPDMSKPTAETANDYIAKNILVKDVENINFSPLLSTVDTLYSDKDKHYKLINPERTENTRILIYDVSNVDSLFVNGALNKSFKPNATGRYFSPMFGVALDSAVVRIVKKDLSKPVTLEVHNVYRGFLNDIPIPDNAIWSHPTTRILYRLEY